jgi:hypothetical protein
MDWNFLVGIGTIILAVATILLVIDSNRRTEVLLKGLNLQIGQQIPRLFVKRVDFGPDFVKIEIQNVTNVPAFSAGLETRFFVIGQRLYADEAAEREIGWGEAIVLRDQGKTLYGKYYWAGSDTPRLRSDNREVQADAGISFFSPEGVSVYFPPNSIVEVETKPRFLIAWPGEQGFLSSRGMEFDEFRKFLLSNDVRAVAVVMSLLCKDGGEVTRSQGYVASFVVRADLDRSLAESGKNQRRFDFIPLSHEERLSGDSWVSDRDYRGSYSNWHVF